MISLNRVIYFLVLAFPVVLLLVKPLALIIFIFLVIIGIYLAIIRKQNPFRVSSIKLFSWLSISYFGIMAFSVLVSNEAMNSWMHLSRISYFLVAPFVALSIVQVDISVRKITRSFKMGAIFAGMISLVGFLLVSHAGRFSGMYNPNTFGDLMVVLLFLSIVNITHETKKEYFFSLLSVVFGVTGVAMSASRGSVITLLVLSVLYIVLMYTVSNINYKRIWMIVLIILSTLAINIFGLNDTSNRLFSIKTEVVKWTDGDSQSSAGQRLEMYELGLKAFVDSPIIGYGYHNCGIAAARYAKQDNLVQKHFDGRWHLHNEMLTNMVNAGILGLIFLLALFILPFRLFLQKLKLNSYAAMGVILIIGYVLLGLTHTLFGYEYETAFFVFTLSYLMNSILLDEDGNDIVK